MFKNQYILIASKILVLAVRSLNYAENEVLKSWKKGVAILQKGQIFIEEDKNLI